jgi:sphingolipid delta-4 desaturase
MSSSVSTSTVTQPQRTAAGSKAAPTDKQDDFFWTYTEEPHATRRQAIIKAHPEVHIT